MDYENIECDFVLLEGDYLSLYYRGDYGQSYDRILDIINYAKEKGYQLLSNPFEIYEVDNRDTIRSEEFLTEIQVRIQTN
ncbi:GyrI-like domain-containing protein [Lysinibacillus telephonicus]|uniref:GyrI-like domain-containing protein n=1 Tax=Lysinibacillus telephonicus TaxID=1714840 RepID=UPI00163998B4|nr:GyrI-like domain-containing protein [Lysinibacillus telephonicus]